jgi:hypothetical protein
VAQICVTRQSEEYGQGTGLGYVTTGRLAAFA